MRIEMLRTVKHEGRTYTGPEPGWPGDRVTVPDHVGAYFCAAGWARDLAGQVPTAAPSTGPVTLDVHSSTHQTQAELKNG